MSGHDDAHGVIHRLVPDDQVERLLTGRPGGADEGDLAPVAQLLAALREPGRPDELVGSDELFTKVTAAARAGDRTAGTTPRRTRPVARLMSGKVAVIVAAVALSGSAAAASSGRLPDPVQRTVSAAFARVGIDLPSPAAPSTVPPTVPPTVPTGAERTPPDTPAMAPSATSPSPGTDTTRTPDATSAPSGNPSTAPNGTTTGTATPGSSAPGGTTTPSDPTWLGPCRAHEAAGQAGSVPADDLSAAAAAAGLSVEAFCAERAGPPRPDPASDDRGASGSTPAATAPGQVDRRDPDGSSPGTPADAPPGGSGRDGSTPAATAPGAPTAKPGGRPPPTPGSVAPTTSARRGP